MLRQRNGEWGVCGTLVVIGVLVSKLAWGVDVAPEEQAAARRWIAAKFVGTVEAGPRESGLAVLANHDSVVKNTRGEGLPLTIAKIAYARGLYCHAVSHVVVRLPGPGKTFTAVVGVDSNPRPPAVEAASCSPSVSEGSPRFAPRRCAREWSALR